MPGYKTGECSVGGVRRSYVWAEPAGRCTIAERAVFLYGPSATLWADLITAQNGALLAYMVRMPSDACPLQLLWVALKCYCAPCPT